ncbi:MAG: methionine--tRNA ligase [Candidatus Wallbacteria bacterium]|nr:methionine--tRNA ligase [Candidatus Wallbacteria bacterium]
MKERILVTSALPYANGPIHLGHIAGAYLPADIYVRFKRLTGADIVYICGTDEHGIPITISAEREKVTPREYVDKYHKVIKGIFDQFNIEFDNFGRTSFPQHYDLSQQFFMNLLRKNMIRPRVSQQFYCAKCQRFLADRYVRGTCPKCKAENVRGDECTTCGSWLEVMEILEPRCGICNEKPEIRDTKHWYLQLQDFSGKLSTWIAGKKEWKENVTTFVRSMIKEGLKERAITRDINWGVPIPLDNTEGKVLYVWFDAPIGYISITRDWAQKIGKPDEWKKYWLDPSCRVIHFIGKDNIPFHCIVWPSLIMGQEEKYNLPFDVPANEFYNLEGHQFSKSEGWYIELDDFFQKYKADSIRYAIAANAPEAKDSEFTWKDFQLRNNSELANIYGNLANRTLTFVDKYHDGVIPIVENLTEPARKVLSEAQKIIDEIKNCYEKFEVRRACFFIMELARLGNKFYDTEAPWATRKSNLDKCSETMSVCCQLLTALAYASFPVIPESASRLWKMLGFKTEIKMIPWDKLSAVRPSGNHTSSVEILFTRIEDDQIAEEVNKLHAGKKAEAPKPSKTPKSKPAEPKSEALKSDLISINDFRKIKLKVAKVLSAEPVAKSDRLLKLSIEVGSETRQLVAGIAKHYKPEEIVGKNIIIVANLEPAKIMGEISEGMLLAAKNGETLTFLTPSGEISSGSEIS